jgi:hypothetical protein
VLPVVSSAEVVDGASAVTKGRKRATVLGAELSIAHMLVVYVMLQRQPSVLLDTGDFSTVI